MIMYDILTKIIVMSLHDLFFVLDQEGHLTPGIYLLSGYVGAFHLKALDSQGWNTRATNWFAAYLWDPFVSENRGRNYYPL